MIFEEVCITKAVHRPTWLHQQGRDDVSNKESKMWNPRSGAEFQGPGPAASSAAGYAARLKATPALPRYAQAGGRAPFPSPESPDDESGDPPLPGN